MATYVSRKERKALLSALSLAGDLPQPERAAHVRRLVKVLGTGDRKRIFLLSLEEVCTLRAALRVCIPHPAHGISPEAFRSLCEALQRALVS